MKVVYTEEALKKTTLGVLALFSWLFMYYICVLSFRI
jgi:hypothetical protein